ncbi:MAG: FliH/SctL family protein [Opitutales bacterium]
MPKATKFKKTLRLPRPLSRVEVRRVGAPAVPAEALQGLCQQARQEGQASVEEVCNRQIHETREEMLHLQQHVLQAVEKEFAELKRTLSERLPELVLRVAEEVMGALPIDQQLVRTVVEKHVADAAPGDSEVEVRLHPDDRGLVEGLDAQLAERYPQLVFRADPELARGDCQVRTRFGLVDARRETRLRNLAEQISN